MEKPIIMKVWQISKTKQRLVSIPMDSDIHEGDYVLIKKVDSDGL